MAKQVVNAGQADEMTVEGFVFSMTKCVFTSVLVFLTGGLFLILLTWRSDIKLNCLYEKVQLKDAAKILLKDKFEQIFEEDVLSTASSSYTMGERRNQYFVNKKIKYVWDEATLVFVKLKSIDETMTQGDFHKAGPGMGQYDVNDRKVEHGENLIKISVPPIMFLILHEALNPFYLFQAYTVILWSVQFYWKFAVVIAVTSVVAVTVSVWETRRQNRNLRDKVKSESMVSVLRNGKNMQISSIELVPGDVVLIPVRGNAMMEADAVLIEGSCVVNEAMLTGESIPITKIAVPNEECVPFNYDLQRQHVVFCGTEILQGKTQGGDFCKAVVIRTGFSTTKGELVRSILFPPPLDFKFHSDFVKSIYVFLTLGLVGMAYSAYMWTKKGGTVNEILLNSLDILTFVVPPILPAALTANNAFAQKRLQKKGIYCLHSKHICLCGGIDIVAFDKTGTLTEDTLDMAGVTESQGAQFKTMVSDPVTMRLDSRLVQAMASCHSLIKLRGELTGNPLDVKIFEAIDWDLTEQFNEGVNPAYGVPTPTLVSPPKVPSARNGSSAVPQVPGASNLEIALLKTYPFDSAVQRMTVVSKKKGAAQFDMYVKGAPEKVAGLCKPETIPVDFETVLERYTKQGLRVIAAAHKGLQPSLQWSDVDALTRSELEEKAEFLGLVIMQNLVKKETYGAIKELHAADVCTVMVTGDNILTAISVGRDCELVKPDQTVIRVEAEVSTDTGFYGNKNNPNLNVSYTLEDNNRSNMVYDSNFVKSVQERNYVFACDGKTFGLIRDHDNALLERIVQRGKVFARMLPEQKIHLIECMKDLGRQVIMCGDGCNDCGALKAAHAGISLSMAEASVAAPFTSRNVHIGCVPYLIREGRATMVSAFASFKFGVAFCFSQLIAVLLIFSIGTEPSDNQYLVVDIGYAAVPIIMIGNCGPFSTLVKQKPLRHLLSFLPLFSIITFLLIQTVTYVIIWEWMKTLDWFEPYEFVAGLFPPNPSYEQTSIFLLSCSAATVAAIVFSKSAPYRKPLYTNGIMLAWTVTAVTTTIFLTLYNSEDYSERLNLKIGPMNYRLCLLAIMAASLVVCYVWEVYIVDAVFFTYLLPWYKEHIRGPHLPFERLEEELRGKSGWPPIGDCKNNEIKIAVSSHETAQSSDVAPMTTRFSADTHEMPPPPPYPTLPDVTTTQSQQQHFREVRKNIQNRWSAGSPTGGGGGPEEGQHLLSSDAQDSAQGSPIPAPRASLVTSLNPPPSNAQLQKVINDALLREQQQSKVLSTTMTNPSQSHHHLPRQTTTSSYSVSAATADSLVRQETIC